jgi:hypothetical protein
MPDFMDSLSGGLKAVGKYARRAQGIEGQEEQRQATARYYNTQSDSIESEQRMMDEQMRRAAFIEDATRARSLIDQGRPDLAQRILEDRMQVGQERGLDMRDTAFGLQLLQEGDTGGFIAAVDPILSQWEQAQAANQEVSDPRTSPKTEILPDGSTVMVNDQGGVLVELASGETLRGKDAVAHVREAQRFGAEMQGLRSGEREAGKQAIALSGEAYKQLETVGSSKRLMQEAIQALDSGAQTGPIMSRLPTVTNASAALDQVQKQLGLNVLQNTTFGALSEKELAFALETGLPTNMRPDELKQWLQRKYEAQTKLENYLYRAAVFLGQPGNTVADWMESQKQQSSQGGEIESEFDALWGGQ